MITITGIGDHLRPEWLIIFTGMRNSGTWGDHPPLPDVTEQALEERQQGSSVVAMIKILETDETDELARAWARLGRTVLAAEAAAQLGKT